MAVLIALLFFAALMAAITWFGYRLYARPGRVFERLGEARIPSGGNGAPDRGTGLPVRVLQKVGTALPVTPEDVRMTRRDLIAAGYRSDTAVAVFYGVRILVCAILLLFAITFRHSMTSNGMLGIVIVV